MRTLGRCRAPLARPGVDRRGPRRGLGPRRRRRRRRVPPLAAAAVGGTRVILTENDRSGSKVTAQVPKQWQPIAANDSVE